jgi:hypothetical protein
LPRQIAKGNLAAQDRNYSAVLSQSTFDISLQAELDLIRSLKTMEKTQNEKFHDSQEHEPHKSVPKHRRQPSV